MVAKIEIYKDISEYKTGDLIRLPFDKVVYKVLKTVYSKKEDGYSEIIETNNEKAVTIRCTHGKTKFFKV